MLRFRAQMSKVGKWDAYQELFSRTIGAIRGQSEERLDENSLGIKNTICQLYHKHFSKIKREFFSQIHLIRSYFERLRQTHHGVFNILHELEMETKAIFQNTGEEGSTIAKFAEVIDKIIHKWQDKIPVAKYQSFLSLWAAAFKTELSLCQIIESIANEFVKNIDMRLLRLVRKPSSLGCSLARRNSKTWDWTDHEISIMRIFRKSVEAIRIAKPTKLLTECSNCHETVPDRIRHSHLILCKKQLLLIKELEKIDKIFLRVDGTSTKSIKDILYTSDALFSNEFKPRSKESFFPHRSRVSQLSLLDRLRQQNSFNEGEKMNKTADFGKEKKGHSPMHRSSFAPISSFDESSGNGNSRKKATEQIKSIEIIKALARKAFVVNVETENGDDVLSGIYERVGEIAKNEKDKVLFVIIQNFLKAILDKREILDKYSALMKIHRSSSRLIKIGKEQKGKRKPRRKNSAHGKLSTQELPHFDEEYEELKRGSSKVLRYPDIFIPKTSLNISDDEFVDDSDSMEDDIDEATNQGEVLISPAPMFYRLKNIFNSVENKKTVITARGTPITNPALYYLRKNGGLIQRKASEEIRPECGSPVEYSIANPGIRKNPFPLANSSGKRTSFPEEKKTRIPSKLQGG